MKVLNQHSIVSVTDVHGFFTYVNDQFCKISEYSRVELLGQHHNMMFSELHPSQFLKSIDETVLAGNTWQGEICHRTKSGELYWLQTTIAAVWNETHQHKMNVVIQTDVTVQRQKYKQLKLLQYCVERTSDVIIISEAEPIEQPGPRIVFTNKAFETVTGFTCDEAIGKTPRMLQGAESDRPTLDRIRKALSEWTHCREEVLNYTKDGQPFWAELDISPVATEEGHYTHWVSVQRDITQRKLAEEQKHQLTFYNALTGLPNRLLMMERLGLTITAAKLNQKKGALLFIDIDEFKAINDIHNHSCGDAVLRQVGQRLAACSDGHDVVAHIGGDEFVVIIDHLSENSIDSASYAEALSNRMLTSLRQPFQTTGKSLSLTASIGIAIFDENAPSNEQVLKQAEIAMYQGKKTGRNCLRFFDPTMQESIEQRAELDKALVQAISDQEFYLHFQPQVDSSGRIVGAEALIRWVCPKRGVIMPDDFITRAEENGMILPIGKWVLNEACRQLQLWDLSPSTRNLTLSINVSAQQFHQFDFQEQVFSAMVRHKVKAGKLKFELTESIMLGNVENAISVMRSLKQIGIQLSLDDFGTGYSSLEYLKKLPIDQLKIDQSFVSNLVEDSSDRAITKTIIAITAAMSLGVIAEGVETIAQFEILKKLGCTHFQGYFFSHPVSIEEFELLVAHP